MSSEIVQPIDQAEFEAMERVIVGGDLSKLTPEQRMNYYMARCAAAGLDYRTQPFQYITLQGKLTLYATKTATDQLCAVRKISTSIIDRQRIEDIYIVTCRATTPDNRFTDSTGAVTIGLKKGDDLCNLLMKAETKAKRRAVLALCGLGMMDETETETIAGAQTYTQDNLPAGVLRGSIGQIETQQAEQPASERELQKYDEIRELATVAGFVTPKGNPPKVLEANTPRGEVLKRTAALEEWLEAQEQADTPLINEATEAAAREPEPEPVEGELVEATA